MKSAEIRKRFFDFFIARNHEAVPSSSLIPAQDPTLLFANAGMNQFKDVFLGTEKRNYKRAVSIQKCVRAGGKHNDLDIVGFTKRHLTFFEMMGNFSFGDYFKEDAITYAWDFLTKEVGLPIDKLHATVFTTDDEAYAIWQNKIKVPQERIHRLGEKENFWQMGDIGPCGPCTEIHIDRGPAFGCQDIAVCGPACDCDRFLEIWNLVFMQFDRQADGTLKELTQKGVDTGMGLERLSVIVQGKDSVFTTDVFAHIIGAIEKHTGKIYKNQTDETKAAFHVLADHIRSSSFLVADGCAPSNEGRGYVLRKIIRRAALFAQKLSETNFFAKLVNAVIEDMGAFYPDLEKNRVLITKVLESEISKFSVNLISGQQMLAQYIKDAGETRKISGERAFKLYDTYGFPIELILLMSGEKGFDVDLRGFEQEMEKQRLQSGKKTQDPLDNLAIDENISTEFTGYVELETNSNIVFLITGNQPVQSVRGGTDCWVMTYASPFFIVGGGQVPDEGWLVIKGHKIRIKQARHIAGRIAVLITAPCDFEVGNPITSIVDPIWRTNAMKNHTGTHLLQAALIELLGPTIKQSGSLVHPDYLRFDFTYPDNLSAEQIRKVEELVNEKVRQNIKVDIEYTTMREAVKKGALAFFGDKYNPDDVRMVKIGSYSTELCGGTHVPFTGAIGAFKIIEVSALSAGHRRIVAVTGPKAIELFQEIFETAKQLSKELKVSQKDIVPAIIKLQKQLLEQQKSIRKLKQENWRAHISQWLAQMRMINKIPCLVLMIEDVAIDELREISQLIQQQRSGLVFLIGKTQEKIAFFGSLAKEYVLDLKNLQRWLSEKYALRGNVVDAVIQGGGASIPQDFIEQLYKWVEAQQ